MAKLKKKKVVKAVPKPKAYAPALHLTQDTKTATTSRYDDVYSLHQLGKITEVLENGKQAYDIISEGKANLRLEFWSERTVRFRITYGPAGRDFSYARDPKSAPSPTKIAVKKGRTVFSLTTDSLKIDIAKADGKVTIQDKATKVILHEYATAFTARTTLKQGLEQVRIQLKTDKQEAIYGLGDKGWDTDLQGTYWANYNEDAFAFGKDRKTNYRSIPFYYGLRQGQAYGLFLDNPYKSHFDFNSDGDGLTTIWADGGEMDYYFFQGPKLDTV
ncbi:MAG: hypothetical protein AAGF89_14070, partial [Bacteroidota bacterium]